MMNDRETTTYLSRYELLAIAIPGANLLLGLYFLYGRQTIPALGIADISLGSAGVFAIASFCAGHIVQAIAELLGRNLTKPQLIRRFPKLSRFDRASVHLVEKFPQHLLDKVSPQCSLLLGIDVSNPKTFDWSTAVFDIIVIVRNAGRNGVFETFLAVSHLHRGLTLVFLVFTVAALIHGFWIAAGSCLVIAYIMLERALQFNRQYGWELWRQFLLLDADRLRNVKLGRPSMRP
jgi:hypothetical protein